jgi:transposase-like protein
MRVMPPVSPVQFPDALPLCQYCQAPTKVDVHSKQHGRHHRHQCRKTFTQSLGTPLYGVKTALNVVRLVLTLLVFGCSLPTIVMAFKGNERTLADWLDKADQRTMRVRVEQELWDGQIPGKTRRPMIDGH